MRQYFRAILGGAVFLISGLFGHAAVAEPAPLSQTLVPATTACVMDVWGKILAPEPQVATLVEKIETEKGVILAFEFDALVGEYAKVFIFLLDGETCFTRAVSFGSYAMTNTFAVETGDAGPDGRLYHGDIYEPEAHSTLEFSKLRPTYQQARKTALEVLK